MRKYIVGAFVALSLVAILVKWLDGIVPAGNLAILFLTAVVYSANAYGMGAALFTSVAGSWSAKRTLRSTSMTTRSGHDRSLSHRRSRREAGQE